MPQHTPSSERARRSAAGLYAGIGAVFLVLVVALIGGIVWYNFKKTSELSLVEIDKLIEEMSDKVIERIDGFYDPPTEAVTLLARSPGLRQTMSMEPQGLKLLTDTLERYPQIFDLYLGTDDGGFFMLTRAWIGANEAVEKQLNSPKDAFYAVEQIAPDAGERHAVWTFLRRDGTVLEQRPAIATDFDPRNRPWFHAATSADAMARTPPYIAAATRETVVTLSQRATGSNAVVGADISLSDLSVFLTQQRITPLTEVLLFNRAGEVTAHPLGVEIVKSQDGGAQLSLAKLSERSDPVLDALAKALPSLAPTGGTLRFTVDDAPYRARITPVPERYGTGEMLATITPIDEILAPIRAIQQQTLFYSVALLVVALPLYVVLIFLLVDRGLGRKVELFGLDNDDADAEPQPKVTPYKRGAGRPSGGRAR